MRTQWNESTGHYEAAIQIRHGAMSETDKITLDNSVRQTLDDAASRSVIYRSQVRTAEVSFY
jgi:hypothetical protein